VLHSVVPRAIFKRRLITIRSCIKSHVYFDREQVENSRFLAIHSCIHKCMENCYNRVFKSSTKTYF